MKKHKILFVIGSLGNGGAERTVLNIINNINTNLFEVSLCLLNDVGENSYKQFLKNDIEIINLKSRARKSIFKLTSLIKNKRPDIVFSTLSYINTIVFVSHKFALSKSKLILREANYMRKDFNMSKISFMLAKFAYKRCDKLISLSKGVEKNLIEHFKINKSKIETIYNPIDIEQIKKMKNQEITISFDKDRFRIVNCGRLTKQKNQQLLIRAVSQINIPKNSWELIIIGDGEEKDNLRKLSIELGIEKNVKFFGFKSNPYKYMAKSDLFILTSSYEGFGHVVAESMVCGTPVLSTDCPYGPSEILGYGEYGWLVPNEKVELLVEKINYLINNKDQISIMKDKLNDGVSRFSSDKIIKQYERVFLEALNS